MPVNLPAGKTGKYMPIFALAKRTLTLGQITAKDGTSNTICIAEAAMPVEWTKPSDLLFEHDDAPLPKLGIRPGTDEFQVAFADGSVREIRKTIEDMQKHATVLKQLIGWKDGVKVDISAILK